MFKLVVLCAFVAAAVAKPDVLIAPAAYSTTIVEPAKTTISEQASSVVHPSPLNTLVYSAYPFAHLIKKRSAALAVSIPSTYIASAPVATTYSYTTPLVSSSILPASPLFTTAHWIKKRAVPLIETPILSRSYVASAPLATSYSYINSAPLWSTYVAPAHLIKKRSAPLITSYVGHSTYSAPWYTSTYAAAAPIISTPYISSPSIAYSPFFIKK